MPSHRKGSLDIHDRVRMNSRVGPSSQEENLA